MNKFLLFSGDSFEPGCGWDDFIGAFSSIDEALKSVIDIGYVENWYQIVDLEQLKIIKQGSAQILFIINDYEKEYKGAVYSKFFDYPITLEKDKYIVGYCDFDRSELKVITYSSISQKITLINISCLNDFYLNLFNQKKAQVDNE